MNLTELLAGVAYGLSHEPQNDDEKNHRVRVLNEVYTELINSNEWEWLQKFFTFPVYAEVSYPTGVSVDIVGRRVELIRELGVLPDAYLGARVTIDFDDGRPTYTGKLSTIDDKGEHSFWHMTQPVNTGATEVGLIVAITIAPRIAMPEDFGEVLHLVSRDQQQGPIPLIDHAEEQHIMLYDTYKGTWPQAFLFDSPADVDRPPMESPEGALAEGGTLTVDTLYRYIETYVIEGRESGRSPYLEVTPTGTTLTAVLTLEPWTEANYRATRRIYREKGNSGIFWLIGELVAENVQDAAASTFTDDGVANTEAYYFDKPPQRYIKVWPQPIVIDYNPALTGSIGPGGITVKELDENRLKLELRYLYRPPPLQVSADVPVLPSEHHRILVHMAVERLAWKRDDTNLAAYHEKRKRELEVLMKKRYLTEKAKNYRFRAWTHSLYSSAYNRPIITRKP